MPIFTPKLKTAKFKFPIPHTVTAAFAMIALAVTGCSPAINTAINEGADDRPVVLTTFTVLADIAANVAGDKLRVESITKVGAEIHGYEPTPGDIRKAAKADLILDNGMGLEAWFGQFVQDVKAPHVVVTEGVETIGIAEDAYKDMPNPHARMSPSNVQIYVNNIVVAFQKLDPGNAPFYEHNGAAYDAGLTEKYIWAASAEQQATPQQIAGAIEFVRSNQVLAVFCEATVSAAPMERVVEAADAVFGGTLYVDSLSAADGPVPTYLELMRYDAKIIVDALTGSGHEYRRARRHRR